MYGQLQVSLHRKNKIRFLRLYNECAGLIAAEKLPRPEKMRRQFELVTALYAMGGYEKGWATMEHVFSEASQIYGQFSVSQTPVQLYWANWALRLNKTGSVKDWISQRESWLLSKGGNPSERIDWLVIAARAHMLDGRLESASQLLEKASRLSPTSTILEKFALKLASAEFRILSGEPKSALAYLSDNLGADSEINGVPQGRYYEGFYKGVSYLRLGEYEKAKLELAAAAEAAERFFGSEHPRSAAARLHLALNSHLSGATGAELVQATETVRSVALVLEEAYSADHPYPKYAKQILQCMTSDSGDVGLCQSRLAMRNFVFNL